MALDLGNQPLANSYPRQPEKLPEFPLAANYCTKCSHLQLSHSVDRSKIFTDYPYVSGTTKTLRDDFLEFAKYVTERHGVGTVLDIACNDGSQLDAFKSLGWTTIGIDPAENLHHLSSKNHITYCAFLNDNHRSITADVIVAQNVLAHTDDPLKFLDICGDIAPNIYIQTSQANMVYNGEFDTIYHEHISFFSERSMMSLAKRANLVLSDTVLRNIHGTSFLFYLTKEGTAQSIVTGPDISTINNFGDKAREVIERLKSEIVSLRECGVKIVGYGAAAKGMTVMNAVGEKLDYVVDDNPLKHNKFTPGLLMPICSPDVLSEEKEPIVVIPLAWNFYPEIKEKVLRRKSDNVTFIKYFPDFVYETS